MVRRAIVSILFGLLMTLAVQVALSLVWRSSEDSPTRNEYHFSHSRRWNTLLVIRQFASFGTTIHEVSQQSVPSEWHSQGPFTGGSKDFHVGPEWVREWLVSAELKHGVQWDRSVVLRGWPMRSAWHLRIGGPSRETGSVWIDGISIAPLSGKAVNRSWVSDRVPIAVIWTGLIGNTATYGVGFFGLTILVPWLRARRKPRHGHCASCGYEVKELAVCPECGRSKG
jgi:hypothetical protein